MTLAFSTTWPKHMPAHMASQPTNFVAKIMRCISYGFTSIDGPIAPCQAHLNQAYEKGVLEYGWARNHKKAHTIREDSKDLWKAGRDIHFVINNRTKQRFQFAPVVKCVSVQKVEISFMNDVLVDGRELSFNEIEVLAKNDGFDSVEDFFSWFNKDFTGKIIHWTNLKY
ncbi:hypothetical protein VS868_11860 [Salinimicrobium sp. 3283s]|uniref:hypothetical protein n=1 Tax=Salinimicrobium sp. 3283s TaxID=3114359 RepID=UPI0031E9A945